MSGATVNPSYFLISVSTRENLELCIKYGLAGFPSGGNGAWTYCEIEDGDFVSFLYGARAHNLYRVTKREAIKNAESVPPWKPLTFKESGKTYSFPFRLYLQPLRTFTEALVRAEFSYVAENLLLRGGYRKTHFQADQTTLQSVSEMGASVQGAQLEVLSMPQYSTFALHFTRNAKLANPPETCRFTETVLQSATRRHLKSQHNLSTLLRHIRQSDVHAEALEVLGEKALPQGHVDLLIKQRVPLGTALKIPIEVKMNRGQQDDILQLRNYMDDIGAECPLGLLIASDFNKTILTTAASKMIKLVRYRVRCDLKQAPTFDDISESLTLEPVLS